MDLNIDLGTRPIRFVGGSALVTLPPPVLKNMNNPKGFKFEIDMNKVVKLVPIYSIFIFGFMNLTLSVFSSVLLSGIRFG